MKELFLYLFAYFVGRYQDRVVKYIKARRSAKRFYSFYDCKFDHKKDFERRN